jgi:hypothetical protein
MDPPFSQPEAKEFLIRALQRDAVLHETGRYSELGEGFDEVDGRLPRNTDQAFRDLYIAFEFWAGWLDSAEHDWYHYDPIREADWPVLARRVIEHLRSETEINEPLLIDKFAPRPRRNWSFFGWLRRLGQPQK